MTQFFLDGKRVTKEAYLKKAGDLPQWFVESTKDGAVDEPIPLSEEWTPPPWFSQSAQRVEWRRSS